MEFVLDDFSGLKDELGYMPRGILFTISLNPYTGNVVIGSQHTDKCDKVLRRIFAQAKRLTAPQKPFIQPKLIRIFEEVA